MPTGSSRSDDPYEMQGVFDFDDEAPEEDDPYEMRGVFDF